MRNRVRKLREAADLRQVDLADLAGVAQSTISDIERGVVDMRASTMVRIAGALGVSLDDLQDDRD